MRSTYENKLETERLKQLSQDDDPLEHFETASETSGKVSDILIEEPAYLQDF